MTLKEWILRPLIKEDLIIHAAPDAIDAKALGRREVDVAEPLGICRKLFPFIDMLLDAPSFLNSKGLMLRIHPFSNRQRRYIIRDFKKKGIENKHYKITKSKMANYSDAQTFIHKMQEHKFIISPEGSWKDCFRHYESFYCKSIPIIQRSEFIKNKLQGLPIIWTEDYSEITERYLNEKYNKMLDQEYDFKFILPYAHNKREQTLIERRSFHWRRKRIKI